MPLSNENQPQHGRDSLESNQPNISEVDENICYELVNKDSMTSVSPEVSPFSKDCGSYITITSRPSQFFVLQVIPASWPSLIVSFKRMLIIYFRKVL